MFSALGLRTLFEIIMVSALFWAIFNEARLIAFEKRIAAYFKRRRLKVVNSSAVRTYRIYDR